jgi:hypothetical protein
MPPISVLLSPGLARSLTDSFPLKFFLLPCCQRLVFPQARRALSIPSLPSILSVADACRATQLRRL